MFGAQYLRSTRAVLFGTAVLCGAGAGGGWVMPLGAQTSTALLVTPLVAGGSPDTRPFIEVALELNIENVHRATIVAHQQVDGQVLLDAREVLAQAGWQRPAAAGTVRVVPRERGPSVTLCRARAKRDHAGCFVSAEVLGEALDVVLEVDLASAAIVIRDAAHLPVVRRARLLRESRARTPEARAADLSGSSDNTDSLSAGPRAAAGASGPPTLIPRALGGPLGVLQLDYLLSAQRGTSVRTWEGDTRSSDWQFSALVRASTHVAGGELGADLRHDITGSHVGNANWMFRPQPGTRRPLVSLGAVDDASPQPVRLHGVTIGRPIRETFQPRMIPIATAAQPAWNYVGMVNDQLISMQRVDESTMAMVVPVNGEAVRYDVIGWDADGRERRYSRMVHSPVAQLAGGDVRYLGSVGRCTETITLFVSDSAPCRWRAATDWRVGVLPRFTARAGTTVTDGRWQPYVGGNAVVGSSMVLQALVGMPQEGAALSQWQATWNPTPWHLVAVSESRSLGRTLHSAQWQLRLPAVERLSLQGMWNRVRGASEQIELAHMGVVAQMGAFRTEVFNRLQRTRYESRRAEFTAVSSNHLQSVGLDLSASPAWLSVRGAPFWVRGLLAYDGWQGGTPGQRASPRLDVRLNGSLSRADIEVGRTYSRADRSGRWTLTVSPRLTKARLTTTASQHSAESHLSDQRWRDRVSTLTQIASGSVVVDAREYRVRASADRSIRGGGLRMRVYLDVDNNGRYDAGEPTLPQVGVVAGNRRAETDTLGKADIMGLAANEPVVVSIDSMSLPLPCWRPRSPYWQVQVPSAGIGELDLGLRYGAIVEGQVVMDGVSAAGAHARSTLPSQLALVNVDGNQQFTFDVMNDGGFSLIGVPAGRYRAGRAAVPAGGSGSLVSHAANSELLVVPAPSSDAGAPTFCQVVTAQLGLIAIPLASGATSP